MYFNKDSEIINIFMENNNTCIYIREHKSV